jgi:uncharacterized protein (TIGR02118 family)
MMLLTVLYPAVDGSRFDADYYVDKHMPLVRDRLGSALKEFRAVSGLSGGAPGSAPTYQFLALLAFESAEAMGAGLGQHGEELFADVPNFTDVQPIVQVSEVVAA